MKLKISNELQPADIEQVGSEPKPNRFRQATDTVKTIGTATVGAGAAIVGGLANLKSKQDIKTI